MTFKGNLGQRLLKLISDEKETPAFEDATCSISLHSLVASAFSITKYLKNKGLRKHQKIVIYNDCSLFAYGCLKYYVNCLLKYLSQTSQR